MVILVFGDDVLLPARLSDARDLALQRQFPETEAADAEFSVIRPSSAAAAAACVLADGEFLFPLLFYT